MPSEERVKLFKLAWDIIGSEFAGRHQQYEMFYAGAPFVVKGAYTFRNYDYASAVDKVQKFLDGLAESSIQGVKATTRGIGPMQRFQPQTPQTFPAGRFQVD